MNTNPVIESSLCNRVYCATVSQLLTITDLGCEREGRRLFSGLNFEICAGEYVELTGPNGSGKSTLLRSIIGLFRDYSGQISCEPFLYVGHKSAISPLLTPLDNCRWFLDLTESSLDPMPALARVGLAGFEEVRCQQLSAGQQRRVALARLMLADRPLWLLDEPLTALDDSGQKLVCELIAAHIDNRGSVLCATHQSLGLASTRALELGSPGTAR